MPSLLGPHARASLKAAVINAENRNRLNEEDRCWRSHLESRSDKSTNAKSEGSSDKRHRKRKEPNKSEKIETEMSKNDKWVSLLLAWIILRV